MKSLLSIVVGLSFSVTAFAAVDRAAVKDVVINIHDVFVPGGFDASSDVYVVASGMFPNSCYKWKTARVTVNRQENIHEVQATAGVSQGMCLMVLVPYSKEINLGQLGQGEHKVHFVNGDGTYLEKIIKIE
jgi:hypothetical protein